MLSVQQGLDLTGTIGTNPAKSRTAAGKVRKHDVLAVGAPCRILGLSVVCEARHGIALEVIDKDVPVGACNSHEHQPLAVGSEAGNQVEAWRGDQWLGLSGGVQPRYGPALSLYFTAPIHEPSQPSGHAAGSPRKTESPRARIWIGRQVLYHGHCQTARFQP